MIEQAVNRAISNLGEKYKILMTGAILLIGGLLTAFFATFSTFATSQMQKSLFLIPGFITLGLLLSLGSLICKLYLEEVKRNKVHLIPTFKTIWVRLLGATYFSIPFLAAFAVLWITIGLFELFTLIPYIGPLLSSLFAFIPFVINIGLYLLVLGGVFALFLLSPLMATEVKMDKSLIKKVLGHLLKNPYKNSLNFLIAIIPILILGSLGYLAMQLCTFCSHDVHPLLMLLQNISFAIPFTALFLFPTIFFFQYSIESYLMIENTL